MLSSMIDFKKGNIMKQVILAVLLAVGASLAYAADPSPVTGNFGLTTDHKFRGISQSQNGAAVQGGVNYAPGNGFYVGNWNTSVSTLVYRNGNGVQSDIYGGYKTVVVKGVTLDVGSYNYFYQRATNGSNPKFDTNEVYVGVGTGPIVVKYSRSLSNYFGAVNSKGTQYYQADVSYPVAVKLTADAHIGRTNVANSNTADVTDYKVGATYNLTGWKIGAHYYTNAGLGSAVRVADTVDNRQLYKNAVVVSASKSF